MSKNGKFNGKTIIVTGGSAGIGGASASEFAELGGSVVVVDIFEDKAQAHVDEIIAAGGSAMAFRADVSVEADVQAMIDFAVVTYGGLDVLHNNAAATQMTLRDDDLVTMDVDVWDVTMAVNLRSAFLGCKHAIPEFRKRGGGVIVNTSSAGAFMSEPHRIAYQASKAAMNALTRAVAVRYGKENIRSVAVAPGITLADKSREYLSDTKWLEIMRKHHATPEIGHPVDIAKLVTFLASDDARFITGSVHTIDGGISGTVPYTADVRGLGPGIF